VTHETDQFARLLAAIDQPLYERLRTAVELGKWPDGRPLTGQQRELSLQAVIMWENLYLAEHERTGFIDRGSKAEGELCDDPQPLVLRDPDH